MLLSAVIGEATDRSRSLTVAVTLHAWIDAQFEAPELLGVAPWRVYAAFAVALVFWAWMLWRWRGERAEGGRKHGAYFPRNASTARLIPPSVRSSMVKTSAILWRVKLP
jgi:hypothetical protein